ncbi:tail completion protein gp17 [Providencia rettgeri]|uniref:DUF3168 domain-containing protein n=1 Tax=Providencia rettgeri TaxID=587 RepID=A0AAW6UK18_PRORE|nr:DUF3168 domain-containing protein [Providencia rettgeri]MDI9093605.1 DUF3168 domain-containing protein [Providencia rettgeri]QPE15918.1 DUF3168 domain-containing protein [Providencia rettgeri]
MTEADIIPLLESVLPDRVFPEIVPLELQPFEPPWCILSLYRVDEDVLSGQAEQMFNIQIDIYSDTLKQARELMSAVREAIKPLYPGNMTERPGYEPDPKLRRIILECQVWQ